MELQALLAFVTGNEGAPWLCTDWTLALPHDAELTIGLNFADVDWLVQVMIGLVHFDREAIRRSELLSTHRGDHFVGVRRFGLFDSLFPHVDTNVSRFHWIVCHSGGVVGQILCLCVRFPLRNKVSVDWVLN